MIVKDSQSNPNRAAQVAKDLIVQDKVNLMLRGEHAGDNKPGRHPMPRSRKSPASRPTARGSRGSSASRLIQAGGPPAWKPFNYVYHYFWGSKTSSLSSPTCRGQLPTNKTVGGLFPNDADGNAWGDKQVGLPPALGESWLQAVRSRPLSEPDRQLLVADFCIQGSERGDPHRRRVAAGLHHVLETGAAAGLQAEGGIDRQGHPVPGCPSKRLGATATTCHRKCGGRRAIRSNRR